MVAYHNKTKKISKFFRMNHLCHHNTFNMSILSWKCKNFFFNFNKFFYFALIMCFIITLVHRSFSVYLCYLIFYETVPSLLVFGHLVVFDSNVLFDTHHI